MVREAFLRSQASVPRVFRMSVAMCLEGRHAHERGGYWAGKVGAAHFICPRQGRHHGLGSLCDFVSFTGGALVGTEL